jgi:hypothetical protein
MHDFGSVVTYVRNGVEMNALVLNSRVMGEEEHLSVAYPNMEVKGQMLTSAMVAKAMQTAFDVKPLADGGINGWKPAPSYEDAAEKGYHQGFYEGLNHAEVAAKAQGKPGDNQEHATSALPTSSDLDAVAEEQKASEATAVYEPPAGAPSPAGAGEVTTPASSAKESAAMKAYREARQKDAEPDVATQLDAAGPAPEPEAPQA